MKKQSLLILFCLLTFSCFPQGRTVRLAEYFNRNSSVLPADKIFLHLDRNLYHPGDTIRFQAYIMDRQTGVFETNSISMHCMLISSASKTIDSARFRVTNSSASGWLRIPADQQFGNYSVIAFTGKMMNYDPRYVFSETIRIDKLRPEQIPPGIKKDSSLYQTGSLQLPQTTVDLRFLPEGGTFVNGIKQKLAFNAVTSTGKTLIVSGYILNQRGEKISSFRSGKFGPGLVELTPHEDDTYTAVLDGDLFTGMSWPLPVPVSGGVVLKVKNDSGGIVDITIEGRNLSGGKYILTMSMNEVLVLSGEIAGDSTRNFRIDTDELPVGTAAITLFDPELKPVAERLVFVNGWRKLNFEISTGSTQFIRGAETELKINAVDGDGDNSGAVISVAVIDSISGFYNQIPFRDIESSMLFDDEFYNNLPSRIKLEGLNNMDDENIDLMLMTYGWRSFRAKEPADEEVIKEIRDYDLLKIRSTTVDEKLKEEIKIITIEGSEITTLKPATNNETILSFDTLAPQVRQVMIMPQARSSRKSNTVTVEFPQNRIFSDRVKSIKAPATDVSIDIPLIAKTQTENELDSAIMIEPITIKGKKDKTDKPLNKYQIQYQWANTTTITKQNMTGCITFEDILVRLQPYNLDRRNKKVYLRPGGSIRGLPPSALIVLDDAPLIDFGGTSYASIAELPVSLIESVTAVKGNRGFSIYGSDALGGVIFVTTKGRAMMDGSYQEEVKTDPAVKNDMARPIRIYRSEIEYYIPKKEEVLSNPEFQYRPTLLWQNEILMDGKGAVKIRFPNNLVKGTIMVHVNGVSVDNIPGSGFYKYTVR